MLALQYSEHFSTVPGGTIGSRMGVVTLQAPTDRLEALRPLVPALVEALRSLQPGQVRRVGAGDQDAVEARG